MEQNQLEIASVFQIKVSNSRKIHGVSSSPTFKEFIKFWEGLMGDAKLLNCKNLTGVKIMT